MKLYAVLIVVLLAISLAGCASVKEDAEPEPYQPPVLRDAVRPEQPEPVAVEELEAEEVTDVEDEKQLELGSTKIKEERQTLLSDVNCTFMEEDGEKFPMAFSFAMANIEEKEWIFAALSYSDRTRFENPIITVNALQVTNDQLVKACGKSRYKEGDSAVCDFALDDPTNTVLRKSLRIGETAVGNPQVNTISLRTTKHAGEIKFYCE